MNKEVSNRSKDSLASSASKESKMSGIGGSFKRLKRRMSTLININAEENKNDKDKSKEFSDSDEEFFLQGNPYLTE